MRACLCPALLVVLLAAGCAQTEPGGYETADRILDELAAADTGSGSLAALTNNADCITEVRTDEYGVEFEVCLHEGGPALLALDESPTVEDLDDPALELVERPRRVFQTDLRPLSSVASLIDQLDLGDPEPPALIDLPDALDEMDAACETSHEAWADQMTIVTSLLVAAATEVAAMPEVVGTNEARDLAGALVERVVLQSGCTDPAPDSSPIGGIGIEALVERGATAAAATEPLYQALWGSGKGPYFYHPDEMAHRLWMRDRQAVDVVVAGTSQTLLGIEPDLIETALGRPVGGVAIPGALGEIQQLWLPELAADLEPSIVLWGIGPLDLVSVCRPDGRAQEFLRLQRLRADAFVDLPWVVEVPPLDRLLGRPGSTSHAETPTVRTYQRRFVAGGDDAFEFAQADSRQLATSLERFRPPFERGDFCGDRRALIGEVIRDLEASGHQVIVFGMPVAPELAAEYLGGSDALYELLEAAAAEVFVEAGADYVGLLDTIAGRGFWYDVVHPTRAGGEAATEQLIGELIALGLS